MTVSFSGTFRIIDEWVHSDSNSVSTPKDTTNYRFFQPFTDGSGDDQMQDQYVAQATVSAGVDVKEDSYDLAGGLIDVFGNTLTFATMKKLIIINRSTTAGEDLTIGGPSAGTTGALVTDLFDGDSDSRLKIKAGYGFALGGGEAGYTVTGGSADVLVVTNAGTGDITYDIIIAGTR